MGQNSFVRRNPGAGKHKGWSGLQTEAQGELERLDDVDLVKRTHQGDERALETLISRYRHFARAKARTFFLAGSDKEDVVQEGMIGLFKSIRDFEPEQGTPFASFAELCISRQILSAIKSANRHKHYPLNSSLSLDAPAYSEDGELRPIGDTLEGTQADPVDLVVSAEEIESIRDALKAGLTELEANVLRLYMDGRSYEEIARVLGNHVKSIDNALQRIKRKLHRHLAERGTQ